MPKVRFESVVRQSRSGSARIAAVGHERKYSIAADYLNPLHITASNDTATAGTSEVNVTTTPSHRYRLIA
jgi:hypothetical protein